MKTLFLLSLCFLLSSHACSQQQRLHVGVDARIELLTIVQYLSGNLDTPAASNYLARVDAHFQPCKNHPAVLKLKSFMSREKGNAYADFTAMGIYFSDFPQFRFMDNVSAEDSISWYAEYGAEHVKEYFRLCKQFARDTKFYRFYRRNQKEYERWAKPVETAVLRDSIIYRLEAFFGDSTARQWHIFLDPLNSYGSHAIPGNNNYGKGHIAFQTGYFAATANFNTPPSFYNGDDRYTYLIWHEGSHVYLAPLFAHYREQILALKPSAAMTDEAWLNEVDENMVRSITAFLYGRYRGTEIEKKEVEAEMEDGYRYVAAMVGALHIQAEKGQPHFSDIFLQLIKTLQKNGK